MRLKDREIEVIKAAACDAFGPDAVVRLFGSRVDDAGRGGDLDLHVNLSAPEVSRGEIPFRVALWKSLDWTDVDVIVHVEGSPLRWIDMAAFRSGIVL